MDEIEKLQKENEELRIRCAKNESRMWIVSAILVDYDGYRTAEDLMSLCDEVSDILNRKEEPYGVDGNSEEHYFWKDIFEKEILERAAPNKEIEAPSNILQQESVAYKSIFNKESGKSKEKE